MSDNKKNKIDLDYEHNSFEKSSIQPTQAFDLHSIDDDLESLKEEYAQYDNDELIYKLENEELSVDVRKIINEIIASRK